MSEKRHFELVIADAKYSSGKDKGSFIDRGRYTNKDPMMAAKKAATRIFSAAGVTKAMFMIRETTRGGSDFVGVYEAEKVKRSKPVTFKRTVFDSNGKPAGKEDVVKTHDTVVKSIRDESKLRAFYARVGKNFPSDVMGSEKKGSRKKSSSKKMRGGRMYADEMDEEEDMDDMMGGTASCCQTASVDDIGRPVMDSEAHQRHLDALHRARQEALDAM